MNNHIPSSPKAVTERKSNSTAGKRKIIAHSKTKRRVSKRRLLAHLRFSEGVWIWLRARVRIARDDPLLRFADWKNLPVGTMIEL